VLEAAIPAANESEALIAAFEDALDTAVGRIAAAVGEASEGKVKRIENRIR